MAKKGQAAVASAGNETSGSDGASEELAKALRAGAADRAEKLLDEEFTHIDAAGAVHSRAAAVPRLRADPPPAESDRTVREYGEVALVADRRSADGGETQAIEVWVRRKAGWRLLVHHLNKLADPAAPAAHPPLTPRPADAPPPDCRNPCEIVPYAPPSDAERGIIASFQKLENAVIRNDADEWVKYMADEFVVYRTNQRPTTRAERAAALRRQKEVNAETFVAEVESMRLWVFGDAAIMRADHLMPGNRRPPYRATRVWVKRDGRWQMAVSQQTTRAA